MSDPVERAEALLDADELAEAWATAAAALTSTLSASGRAALHRVAGLAAVRLGDSGALEHLEAAFDHDPRDGEVAMALGQLAWVSGDRERAADVFEALWIHNAPDLSDRSAAVILRRIADARIATGDLDAAASVLEQLVERAPDDADAARTRVDVLSRLGSVDEAIEARARLLSAISAPLDRVPLLHAQADDLRDSGRFDEALGLLVEAVTLRPHDDVFETLCGALRVHGRHRELAGVLAARLASAEGASACTLADELADLAAGPLADPFAAAEALERGLDADPSGLHRFERITHLLSDAGAWRELHDAYAHMIQRAHRHGIDDPNLLGLLWRNLGEVDRVHLGEHEAAVYAFQMAARLLPDDRDVQAAIVELGTSGDHGAASIGAMAEVLDRAPDRLDIAERFGAALLRGGEVDRAWLVLREVVAGGGGTASVRDWIQRVSGSRPRLGARKLPTSSLARVMPAREDLAPLDTVFAVAWHALGDHYVQDIEDYDVTEANRVDTHEDLLLARLVHEAATVFDLERVPRVYESDAVDGFVPAARPWPTFLVSPALLSGRSEAELRAHVGLRLAMSMPGRTLAVMLPAERLKLLLAAVIHHVHSGFDVELTPDMERVQRRLRRGLDPAWSDALRAAVQRLFTDERLAHVDRWCAGTLRDAARLAVVFADSATAVRQVLAVTPVMAGSVAAGDALDDLSRFGWSTAHVALRAELGLTIEG